MRTGLADSGLKDCITHVTRSFGYGRDKTYNLCITINVTENVISIKRLSMKFHLNDMLGFGALRET